MASTRDKNAPGNYKLEQSENTTSSNYLVNKYVRPSVSYHPQETVSFQQRHHAQKWQTTHVTLNPCYLESVLVI